jgi:hypothetical protein
MTTPLDPGAGEGPAAPLPGAGEGPAGGPPPGPGEAAPGAVPATAPTADGGGFTGALANFFRAILRPLGLFRGKE